MRVGTKLGAGATLAIMGGIGMILAPTLGATALPRPWSFLAGLAVGLLAGLGTALTTAGLVDARRRP